MFTILSQIHAGISSEEDISDQDQVKLKINILKLNIKIKAKK